MAKITPCFENGKGALLRGLKHGIGFGTTELIVARARRDVLDPQFLQYLFSSSVFRSLGESHMYGAGGQKRVPDDFVRDFATALPPIEEQRLISSFLTDELATLDALVAEQERMIELLKEKRQAVISHAVTKGLNPNAPLKPSGIEWLGDIPAHWRVVPLMRLTPDDRQIMYGIVLPGPDVDEGVPIVKGGDVAPGRLTATQLKRTTFDIESAYVRSRLKPNDIVYSIRGSIGDAELVPKELEGANITQDVARVAPKEEIEPRWLLHALRSDAVFGQLDSTVTGATIRGINIFSLKRARIPLPPASEQRRIAEFVFEAIEGTDMLVSAAEEAVRLLSERRSALISAAVTGQIDVRNLKPSLVP